MTTQLSKLQSEELIELFNSYPELFQIIILTADIGISMPYEWNLRAEQK